MLPTNISMHLILLPKLFYFYCNCRCLCLVSKHFGKEGHSEGWLRGSTGGTTTQRLPSVCALAALQHRRLQCFVASSCLKSFVLAHSLIQCTQSHCVFSTRLKCKKWPKLEPIWLTARCECVCDIELFSGLGKRPPACGIRFHFQPALEPR